MIRFWNGRLAESLYPHPLLCRHLFLPPVKNCILKILPACLLKVPLPRDEAERLRLEALKAYVPACLSNVLAVAPAAVTGDI